MKFLEDDKAQRLIDLFPAEGQVNVAYYNDTDVVTAWHKHKNQDDYVICLKGSFKVGLVDPFYGSDAKAQYVYLSDKNMRVYRIPSNMWHGWRALEPNSIMLYYMTKKYDPKDIERKPSDSFKAVWYPDDG